MRLLSAARRPAAAVAARRRVTPLAPRGESTSASPRRHRLLFLGTPAPAASVLSALLSAAPSSTFDVVGVVTQPGKPQGRKRVVVPSPVAEAAAGAGFEDAACASVGAPLPPRPLLTPHTPKDAAFLDAVTRLAPDLAVTVAYGGLLPQKMLDLPPFGTLNIHPSLLPRWRGAAPVQRALEAGDGVVGVSVAYTVLALDSGPVLASTSLPTPPDATAPELLSQLMDEGARLLLESLPSVWDGTAVGKAVDQDPALATHAPRLSTDDGRLNLAAPSSTVYNAVRATVGWPGARLRVVVGEGEAVDVKVGGVQPLPAASPLAAAASTAPPASIVVTKQGLLLVCGDGGVLSVETVTPPGRKVVDAGAFVNGVGGRTVTWVPA